MRPTTLDAFCGGRLRVCQHRDGYRFSIDAVLLAGFARPRPGRPVVDLGAGCGILPLLTVLRHPTVTVTGVEIQAELASLAEENARRNGMADRVRIVRRDLRAVGRTDVGGADLVMSNPPYRSRGGGRINPDDERAVARHELRATIDDVAAAGRRLLDKGGRLAAVYPAVRAVDLLTALRRAALEPKRLRWVHSRSDGEARMVLVEAAAGGRPGLRVEAPLVVYNETGAYTPEVAALLSGETA